MTTQWPKQSKDCRLPVEGQSRDLLQIRHEHSHHIAKQTVSRIHLKAEEGTSQCSEESNDKENQQVRRGRSADGSPNHTP